MSRIRTNETNLPQPLVDALVEDSYYSGDSDRSVTTLIDSPRHYWLVKDYEDVITEDVTELMARKLGNGFHDRAEAHAKPPYFAEIRFYLDDVHGWKISGAVDLVHQVNDGSDLLLVDLWDYKTCSVWAIIFGKKDWERQLNLYRHLVENFSRAEMKNDSGEWVPLPSDHLLMVANRIMVRNLHVAWYAKDWTKSGAQRDPQGYPQLAGGVVDIPVWERSEAQQYLSDRVKHHQLAEELHSNGDELPDCSDEEMWRKPTTFAVMKKGRKRANKVEPTMDKAVHWLQKNWGESKGQFDIVERPGVRTRCQDWCKAAEFCGQHLLKKMDESIIHSMKKEKF